MTKVFGVYKNTKYEGSELHALFSTRDKADEEIDRLKIKYALNEFLTFYCNQHEVDFSPTLQENV
jgi:hypothetical protein